MRLSIFERQGFPFETALQQLLAENPHAQGPRILLGQHLLQSGHPEAESVLESVADQHGGSAFNLGVIALNRGELSKAIDYTIRAVALDPGSTLFATQLENLETLRDRTVIQSLEGNKDPHSLLGTHVGQLSTATCRTSIVVVTYNSEATIWECLTSALSQLEVADEILVIDNASTDKTSALVDRLSRRDPRVKISNNFSNLGYSKAVNQGIKKSSGEIILLLNPDTVLTPGSLGRLTAVLGEEFSAVGPLSEHVGGDQFVGHYLEGEAVPRSELGQLVAARFDEQFKETKFIAGFCLMARRELFNQVGLLCEETELGADDLEFSWRLAQLGYKLKVALGAFVHHVGGASFAHESTREMARIRIQRSDRALINKLARYYGGKQVPGSVELFGTEILTEALHRVLGPH